MSREAAQIAREAARIVQERGLAKGVFQDAEGRVCMHGAVGAALGCEKLKDSQHVYMQINEALERHIEGTPNRVLLGLPGLPGVAFNDHPATTAIDVAKVLLKVADDLDVA